MAECGCEFSDGGITHRCPTHQKQMASNNPEGEKTGHFTGRCMCCGSNNLWDDATYYGCNACKMMFPTAHIAPREIPNHPRDEDDDMEDDSGDDWW